MNSVWETLVNETAHMLKRILRRPGFILITSVTLGIALGASVLAFAVLYGYLFRPLPFVNGNQLLVVRQRLVKAGMLGPQVSVKFYHKLTQLPEFHNAGLMDMDGGTVVVSGRHEFDQFTELTPSTFTLLGVKPLLGRSLSDASGVPGGPQEIVLSYGFWQTAFAGRTDVLGKTVEVDGTPMQVVGVMPKQFLFPIPHTAFWIPFVITPTLAQNGNINYWMLARIPPGWNTARVNAFLGTVRDRQLASESPSDRLEDLKEGYVIDAVPWRQVLLSFAGGTTPFWGLFAITLLLLFLATLNTMNLAVARQHQRFGELQLRQILGANRSAIVRMTLLEYLPVLFGMGVIAALLAGYCIALLHVYQLPSPFMPFEILFDPVAIAYLIVVAFIVMGCIAGSAVGAALLGQRRISALQELSRQSTPIRAFRNTQRVFGAAQICIALILVICSVLLGQSLIGLLHQPLHFDSERVTVAAVMLPQTTNAHDFWNESRQTFNNLPDTESAALSNMVPFSENNNSGMFYPYGNAGRRTHAWAVTVSPEFFNTLGIHALFGRLFGEADEQVNSNDVNVIVSAALAQAFYGKVNVVGEVLNKNLHIIGVVPTVPWQLDPNSAQHGYAVYMPTAVNGAHFVHILIKSNATPAVLFPAIRRAVTAAAPNATIYQINTLPQIMQQSSLNRAALTWLVVGFGALAFLIAVFGVYAIVAYSTRLRFFEFAIRQVLGASREAILVLTLREIAVLFLVGGVTGLAVAYVIAQGLRSQLYGIGVLDPTAYLGSLAIIAAAVFIAAAWPVLRAARQNPAEIMRQ